MYDICVNTLNKIYIYIIIILTYETCNTVCIIKCVYNYIHIKDYIYMKCKHPPPPPPHTQKKKHILQQPKPKKSSSKKSVA